MDCRRQAEKNIIWANIDWDLYHYLESLRNDELNSMN